MKTLYLAIIVGFGLSLMLPSTMAHAQTQQNYSHGIGSNSSALYNSVGLTYQQCQNKISDGFQKIVDSLDGGKAVALALASPDFQAKVAGHTYELTDISTNDTWDNSLCGNVKRTAVGVSFNLLDTPNTYLESVNVAEDANMTKVTEVGTETTPICSNNCPPAIPANWNSFTPDISSDFHFNGVMIPNGTIPVSVDLANAGNSTLYNVHIASVDSPLLQNFKTGYGNFTLQVGQEKTILGTMSTPSEISNVSSSLNWMVYADNQYKTTGSKEFSKTVNLAIKSTWVDGSISYSTILPPLKQDIPVSDVQCRQGLELVIKSDDYSPACVTPSTNQTLVERGWGESLDSLKESPLIKKMEVDGLQQNYGIGQPINATIKYTGWSFNDSPDVKIFDANGSQVWFNCPECVTRTELAIPYPGVFGTYSYPVRDPNGNPPMVNKTGTYTMIASLDNETAEEKFVVLDKNNQTNPSGIDFTCEGTTVPPPNYRAMMFPVLLMNSNSTACAKLTFTVVSNYKNCNGQTCQNIIALGSTLHIGDMHYENNGDEFGITSGKDFTNSFKITAIPETVDLANYPIGSNFTVTYMIKVLPNATGFYDQSIPMPPCSLYPLAVGYAADQVNSSDFSKGLWNMLNHSCVSGLVQLSTVEISGMNYTEIKLG